MSKDFGPYTLDFSLSGRYMVAGGRKGHMVLLDMKNMDLIKEFQVREIVRDVAFLHNQKLFAAAQKKYVYMYSDSGTELHCLKLCCEDHRRRVIWRLQKPMSHVSPFNDQNQNYSSSHRSR